MAFLCRLFLVYDDGLEGALIIMTFSYIQQNGGVDGAISAVHNSPTNPRDLGSGIRALEKYGKK
jgi:hypothetical protein